MEGIGYDFIPTVLDRTVADVWLKSNDKVSTVNIHMVGARVLNPIVRGVATAGGSEYSTVCTGGFRLKTPYLMIPALSTAGTSEVHDM